eukprot:gene20381-biopygen7054
MPGRCRRCSPTQSREKRLCPRPVRVRFFESYRAALVRSASAAVFPRAPRSLQGEQDSGAGTARARAWCGGGAGVARACPAPPGQRHGSLQHTRCAGALSDGQNIIFRERELHTTSSAPPPSCCSSRPARQGRVGGWEDGWHPFAWRASAPSARP